MVEHANVVELLFSATDPGSSLIRTMSGLCFTPIAFDFSVWEIWGALLLRRTADWCSTTDQPLAGRFLQTFCAERRRDCSQPDA